MKKNGKLESNMLYQTQCFLNTLMACLDTWNLFEILDMVQMTCLDDQKYFDSIQFQDTQILA